MRRRSDRNPEFTRGDGVHIVPHNPAAEITYGITRYGWFIEPSEKGARVLLRSRDGARPQAIFVQFYMCSRLI